MLTDVFTVPEKASGRFRRGQPEKPSSGFDVDSVLNKGLDRKKNKISKDNSIPEFKQALRHRLGAANKDEELENAVKDMAQIVQSLIKESMGDKDYARAQENIGVMREQCIEFEISQVYNDFLRDLKKQISSGALGGDRREMWSKYIMWPAQGRLGLITKRQSESSDVTEEEAQQVRTGSMLYGVQKTNALFYSSGRARLRPLRSMRGRICFQQRQDDVRSYVGPPRPLSGEVGIYSWSSQVQESIELWDSIELDQNQKFVLKSKKW